jgi:hypothetical protein
MHRVSFVFALAVFALLNFTTPSLALAENLALDEVVVSARKREESFVGSTCRGNRL